MRSSTGTATQAQAQVQKHELVRESRREQEIPFVDNGAEEPGAWMLVRAWLASRNEMSFCALLVR